MSYVFKLEDRVLSSFYCLECNLLFRHGIHLCYYYIAVRYKLKLFRVNLRVHKSVSRIGLIRSDYYTIKHFRLGAYSAPPDPVVKLWENAGNGVPLPFWRGNAVPLAYTMTATYNTSNRKKCVLNA